MPKVLKPWLAKVGGIDVPCERSSHVVPTIRGGGLAQLLGIAVGGVVAVAALQSAPESALLTAVLAAALTVGLVGLVEDVRGVGVATRAGLQLLVGAAFGLALSAITGSDWLWIPIVGLGFAAYVNFANFMDGINGISGLHGLVAGLAYALIGVGSGSSWLVLAGLLTAVAFMVFLPWNLTPPGLFLGDSGSYLLGGLLISTATAAFFTGISPIAALAPLSIYLADTLVTLARRFARGESVCKAHRAHTYQRLTQAGLPHVPVAGMVAFLTACASALGILAGARAIPMLSALVMIALLAAFYLCLPIAFDIVKAQEQLSSGALTARDEDQSKRDAGQPATDRSAQHVKVRNPHG